MTPGIFRAAINFPVIVNCLILASFTLSCAVQPQVGDVVAPIDVIAENPGQALNAGELATLKVKLSGVHFDEYYADAIAKKYAHRPISGDLIAIIQNDGEELYTRISAIWVLGKVGDPVGLPVLKSIIDQPLPDKLSNVQGNLFHNALLCSGMLADDEYLNFLEKASTDAYWLERNPQASRERGEPRRFREHMRLMALNAIALSGSQRAIDMFETGKGVPEDKLPECEWLLKTAKMRNQGFIRVADYDAAIRWKLFR